MEFGEPRRLSPLGHTWIIDIDGTVVKHNGHKSDGGDTLLPGAKEFLGSLPSGDMIIFITSRTEAEKNQTEDFLKRKNIRYDRIIYSAPPGERILVNDRKPSGLLTALAINTTRDVFMTERFVVDDRL
ncbi:MAG: HAD family acid phosphatase [Treponema sp.]|jgi:ribonucleotide monophosphatase NagD (HAD superfamily)|nr:HAD family acid phosphatase [Treponema sp.]